MKKAFTLVELIFVIVIIGVLAAAAIPQFKNLKQSAEANNLIKTTIDGASSAVNAAINYRDLEDNVTYDINDLVSIKGKGWSITTAGGNDQTGTYSYTDPANSSVVSTISLTSNTVTYTVNCANFNDSQSVLKCWKTLNGLETDTTQANEVLNY